MIGGRTGPWATTYTPTIPPSPTAKAGIQLDADDQGWQVSVGIVGRWGLAVGWLYRSVEPIAQPRRHDRSHGRTNERTNGDSPHPSVMSPDRNAHEEPPDR